eukprot:TRINITY_DN66234_c1_g1_i1.p1 TRINITY_DN66234_c1_g1~~TRINITY_DN66234_c1_g1_i1.p1  ORF type:complete len:896 (-),score=486.18 TRINITY_DN66234_c1_g1_i1:477-2819(-)
MAEGEQLIQTGEQSTFFGIILDGALEVDLFSFKKRLEKGACIGEMNFFVGGHRTANVLAPEDAVVAIIKYESLESLILEDAQLHSKLVRMLATASIKLLKEIGERNAKKKKKVAAKSDDIVELNKQEVFIRSRLMNQSKQHENKLQREAQKRKLAERRAKNQQYTVNVLRSKCEKLEAEAKDNAAELERLRKFETEASQTMLKNNVMLTSLLEEKLQHERTIADWEKMYEETQKQIQELKNSNESFNNDSERMQEIRMELERTRLKLKRAQEEQEKQNTELHSHKAELEEQLSFERARRASLAGHVQKIHDQVRVIGKGEVTNPDEIDNDALRDHAKVVAELRAQVEQQEQQISTLLAKINDQNQEISRLRTFHAKASHETGGKSKNDTAARLQKQLEESQRNVRALQSMKSSYQTLLQSVSVYQFVRSFRMTKQAADNLVAIDKVLHEVLPELEPDSELAVELTTNASGRQRFANIKSHRKISETERDHIHKMSEVFQDLVRQKKHWKATADNFFNRTITLKKDLLASQQQAQELSQKLQELGGDNESTSGPNGNASAGGNTSGTNGSSSGSFSYHRKGRNTNHNNNNAHMSQQEAADVVEKLAAAKKKLSHKDAEIAVLKRRLKDLENQFNHLAAASMDGGANGQPNSPNSLSVARASSPRSPRSPSPSSGSRPRSRSGGRSPRTPRSPREQRLRPSSSARSPRRNGRAKSPRRGGSARSPARAYAPLSMKQDRKKNQKKSKKKSGKSSNTGDVKMPPVSPNSSHSASTKEFFKEVLE